jgi:DNA-binding IclR family transcriptional regulator
MAELLNQSSDLLPKRTRIHSLSRAFRILEAIGSVNSGLQIKEISYMLRIKLGTCYHTLNTLEDEGLVVKNDDGTYVLGPRIAAFYHMFVKSITPMKLLQEKLYELKRRTNETSYLASATKRNLQIQAVLESSRSVKADIYVRCNDYPHVRVLPRAVMAFWKESEIDEYFQNYQFKVFSERTPKNLQELKEKLAEVRMLGYSIDDEGLYPDARCIAAPVFDAHGNPIAAYGLAVPLERFNQNQDIIIEHLLSIANEMSQYLGYHKEEATS